MNHTLIVTLFVLGNALIIGGPIFFIFRKRQNLDLWRKNLKGGTRVKFVANNENKFGKIGYFNTSTGQFLIVPDDSNYQQFFCEATDLFPEN